LLKSIPKYVRGDSLLEKTSFKVCEKDEIEIPENNKTETSQFNLIVCLITCDFLFE
jgi:hypothetical protein